MELRNSGQLKNYIRNERKNYNMNSNYAYNYYFCREFLKRLFNQNETFVLRGSFAQLAVSKQFIRPLTDIDIITFNKIETGNNCVKDVLNTNYDDIKFEIKQCFVTTNSTIAYRIMCHLDTIQHLITLDLRKDNLCETVNTEIPHLFSNDEKFNVQAVSLEDHIANKLYVIINNLMLYKVLGKEFRRFKDFYDVYKVLGCSNINWKTVYCYLNERIKNSDFLKDYIFNRRLFDNDFIHANETKWLEDKNKYQFDSNVTFQNSLEAIDEIISRRK